MNHAHSNNNMSKSQTKTIKRIRIILGIFILGLVISGVTAFPLDSELGVLTQLLNENKLLHPSGFSIWMEKIHLALMDTYSKYPFFAYGTDWLAFAHLIIAVAFIGPLRDPVKNVWVIEFGMIACILVVPFALVAGAIREIPIGWRLIDCSFGVFGIIPLWLCRREIKCLDSQEKI